MSLFARVLTLCDLSPRLLPSGVDADLADSLWKFAIANATADEIVRAIGDATIRGPLGPRRLGAADAAAVIEIAATVRRTLVRWRNEVRTIDETREVLVRKITGLEALLTPITIPALTTATPDAIVSVGDPPKRKAARP